MHDLKRAITILLLLAGISTASPGLITKFPIYDRFRYEIPIQMYEGKECVISVRGQAVLECYRGVRLSEIYYFSSPIYIKYESHGLVVSDSSGELAMGLAEIRCKPHDNSSVIEYEGRGYRGFLRVLFFEEPPLLALYNMAFIEDYLKGVLPGEIGNRSAKEFEAAKAQAVAARTYAVWKLTDFKSDGRLVPTIADQLYTGKDSEIPLLSEAVEATRGEIVTYGGRAIAAYYHSVCGGHTSAVQNVWPDKPAAAYLVGVPDKTYCSWAKYYSWSENFDLATLQKNISKYFIENRLASPADFGSILDVSFNWSNKDSLDLSDENDGTQKYSRKRNIVVKTDSGIFSVRADKIRWALCRASNSNAILPSTMFISEKIVDNGNFAGLRLKGKGNGHGVGMCQCGAIGQSRSGRNYQEILKFYYKRTKLSKLY